MERREGLQEEQHTNVLDMRTKKGELLIHRKQRKSKEKEKESASTNVSQMSQSQRPVAKKNASSCVTFLVAIIYILSGSTQPLLITLVKEAGLGDPHCQVYMLMYYLGPAMVSIPVFCTDRRSTMPPFKSLAKASFIPVIDIIAQATNYTGASMAGPTLFAIIYSSVTVWAAVYSRIMLGRKMSFLQWLGVFIVFGGLTITATNSETVGEDVFRGAMLVLAGSSLHAMTYVLSEAVMGGHDEQQQEEEHQQQERSTKISVEMNCALQGLVAGGAYLAWQIIYTKRNYHEHIEIPMELAGTTTTYAVTILLSLSLSNLVHALSFFYTLKHFPGGATSAGVMKGLQAVLVFVFTSVVYCGSMGGAEMCFTYTKFLSLIIVCGGVLIFAMATDGVKKKKKENDGGLLANTKMGRVRYSAIKSMEENTSVV